MRRFLAFLRSVLLDMAIAAWVLFTWGCIGFTMVMGGYAMTWHWLPA